MLLTQLLRSLVRQLRLKFNRIDLPDARITDLPYIAHLLHSEVHHKHFLGLNSWDEVGGYLLHLRIQIEALARGETDVAATVHIITVGGSPVGFYVLMGAAEPGTVDLNVLIVERAWRRKGLAISIVATVRESLRKRGFRMAVRCLPPSTGMMALLERLGFEEIITTRDSVRHYFSAPQT